MKWNCSELTIPLWTDRFRRGVGRTGFADDVRCAIFTSQNELDSIIGIRLLPRYVPVTGDLVNFDGSLEFRTAKYLKQKLPFFWERGILKIPIGKKPMRGSRDYKHPPLTRCKITELIKLPMVERRRVCFQTGPILSGFARFCTDAKSVLIFHRVLTHDKQPIPPTEYCSRKSRGNRLGMQRLFQVAEFHAFFVKQSRAWPDPISSTPLVAKDP